MRKLKLNKDKTLTKYGYVEIDADTVLPIKYCGLKRASISASKFAEQYKIPKSKPRFATEEEKKLLEQQGYEVGKTPPMIVEFDLTSKEYIKLEEEKTENILFLDMAIHVDLGYLVEDSEGKEVPLWKSLGLKSEDDIIGMAKWLANLDLTANMYKILMTRINAIEVLGYRSYDDIPERVEEDEPTATEKERELISE